MLLSHNILWMAQPNSLNKAFTKRSTLLRVTHVHKVKGQSFLFVFLILIKQINTLSYLSSSCTSIANLNYEVINPSKNSQEIRVPAKITFRGGDFVAFESNSIKFQRNVKFQALSMLKWGAAPASDCLSLVHFLSSIWKSLYIKSTPEATTFWRDPTQKWDCESPR